MKPFLLFLVLLDLVSRIEKNEATRTLDQTHILLPSLQTRPPLKTPTPNPGTGNSVNMASRITERNFAGRKEVAFASPPPTNAYSLDETHLLLPSLQTRPPVKTPTPNPGTEASVNMAIKTPTPNPGTGNSVNMASRITERNFAGRKKVAFASPPPTNAYSLDETHLLLPSLQTRPPVKTPTPNPGTGNSVNMASRITERNFAGRKEVAFASPPPPPPPTYAYPLHENLYYHPCKPILQLRLQHPIQERFLSDVSIATTQQ
ncbi:hypothetical protein K7X08_029704 [Anisodus acutangulus]|uniref:Uncharacterized protein n=1 Tax=Anisodus acutangulus TaxID=402998 RepID=A0A9Q1L5P6_9SOLA|nr:hypothetical protein K7X08_029704 [Anisodus acutangulus]